ncbi:MAG TPA: AMP-binding protein [Methylomirabilota bacterium]|nr:AMP-binding protein [Methylomirabilota bacterium]
MSRPTHRDACQAFRWEESARAMGFTAGPSVNLGRAIVDRHAASGRAALRWFGKRGEARAYTFDELARLTARFANALRELGVGSGDRVAGFLPRIPEMLIAMIGTWKAGAVYVPIFTGFGPDAIEFRVRHSGARVLVTQWEQRGRLPEPLPDGVAVVTVAGGGAGAPGDVDFWRIMHGQPETTAPADSRRDEPAVLLYTSGSTGPPKGVKIAANFLVAIHPHLVHGADLRADDVFWPTGDPGWGYGLVCYMGALALGVPVLAHEAAPTPEFCLARLRELGVTNLATTPTLLRGVMALGAASAGGGALRVRSASSCGEPLNAEVVRFFREHWGVTVRDQYGSSEFGLPIGNFATVEMTVKPGSMGLPLPGCEIAVVDDAGREVGPGVAGHVGMKPHPEGYYSLGYWSDEDRDREMYRGEWMTCGDLARRDAEGYFWFEGRADDVIKSAGYRIGPFEVESAILKHPAVAEAAVVGKPDALRGQIVKAYVVLKPGRVAQRGLETEIVDVVKTHVGRHQYPREIEFLDRLPKTETGKIQRFLLRGR